MAKKINLLPIAGLTLLTFVVLLVGGTPLGIGRAEAAIALRSPNGVTQAGVNTMPAPTFQLAGTAQAGAGVLTVAWPAHQENDIGLLIIETANQAVTLGANAADWTQVTNSPQGTPGTAPAGTATRLTVFWSRATSGAMGSVGVNDSGNHQIAQIITFRGVVASGNPWDGTPAGDVAATADTAVSIPGGTTTVANTLVVAIVANGTDTATAQTSGWTNASLTGLTERVDFNDSTAANGGGFGVATGVKAAAGAYGATAATLATSFVQGRMSIALRPSMTLTINTPTGTVQNDVMVASIAFRPLSGQFSSNITVTDPLGWTRLDFLTNTANYNALAIYYRVAGASEPASYTWNFACNASCTLNSAAGGIVSFSGVDTGNPIDAHSIAETPATADPLTPPVTTTVANAMLVTSHQIDNNNLWASPPPGPGMTQAFQQTTSSEMIQVSYGLQALPASNIQKQAHDNGGDAADIGDAHILALRPICAVAVNEATYAAANAQPAQATVYWSSSNPALILRKSGSSITDAPANGASYNVNDTIGSSTVVYNGSVVETSFNQGSLTNATTYFYKVFAKSGTCYSPAGTEVNARPEAGPDPAWSYMMANGSTMRAGIAGEGSLNSSGNFGRIISLNTADGTQMWTPVATTGAVQSWLTWLPTYRGWPYRKAITIDHTKVTGALTNFPVLISLTTDADLQANAQASGNDIFFTAADGATKLPHEIETYTSGTGQLVAWVKIPSLSNTTDTVIYMYYGNPTASNQQNAGAVWDTNFKGIWHLPNGTTLTASDSTSNANNGTLQNTPTATTGQIDGGGSFAGASSQYISTATSFANPQDFTVSAWFRTSTASGRKIVGFESNQTGTASASYDRHIYMGTDGKIYFGWYSGVNNTVASTNTLNDGLWHYAVGTHTSGNVGALYIDGVLQGTGSNAAESFSGYWRIGSYKMTGWTPCADGYFTGQIDEVRVSNIARAVDWIQTEHNNQSSPGTFYAVGGAEANSGSVVLGGDQSGWVYSVNTTTGATNWTVNLTGSGADTVQAPVAAQLRAWSDAAFQAAYSEDVLFVPTRNASTTNNKLFALRASDGSILWSFNGTIGSYNVDYIVGMPWVDYARNRVYVVSRAGAGAQASLWVINSLTGALVTSFPLGHIDASPTMSADGATLYVGNQAGTLYAINLNTLAQKWSLAVGGAVKGFVWEDWTTAGRLYLATGANQVRCVLDQTTSGSIQWTTAVTAPSTPLPMDTVLYVGSSDGKVHQLLLSNGTDQKQYTVGSGAYQVGDVSTETWNEIFVPTTEGKLYKLPLPLP